MSFVCSIHTPCRSITSRTWARGVSTTYLYDQAGRMQGMDHSDGTPDVSYTYTRTGQIATAVQGRWSEGAWGAGNRSHSYHFSNIGQLQHERIRAGGQEKTLTRHYDTAIPGRYQGWDLSEGTQAGTPTHWVRYGFDEAGRLNRVLAPHGVDYQYTYLPQSHLLQSVSGSVHHTGFSYESGRNLMTSRTHQRGETVISRFEARFDRLKPEMGQANVSRFPQATSPTDCNTTTADSKRMA